jgi:nitrite reductase/ring-hydroxylating ferredoxin subunit
MNPARPETGQALCRMDEIADGAARGFAFTDGPARFAGFVVRQGAQVFGYEDRCPHSGTPLAMFHDQFLTRAGDLILCSTHGALFRPTDGLCLAGPCAGARLAPWPVRIDGDLVVTD